MAREGAGAHIHQAIQESAALDPELEGSALVGWSLVSEWMDPAGRRWIAYTSGDPSGERQLSQWQQLGYAAYLDAKLRAIIAGDVEGG